MRSVKTVIITVASVALIGFALNAFAHGPMGWGGGWGHFGPGWHHRSGYGPGYNDQLSKDEYRQSEQNIEAFFKETEKLRADLSKKERELQNELAKIEPDASRASGPQKDISDLQAQLDQKRIDRMVDNRELNPNSGPGFMGGGPMRGYGPNGGGYCWR